MVCSKLFIIKTVCLFSYSECFSLHLLGSDHATMFSVTSTGPLLPELSSLLVLVKNLPAPLRETNELNSYPISQDF